MTKDSNNANQLVACAVQPHKQPHEWLVDFTVDGSAAHASAVAANHGSPLTSSVVEYELYSNNKRDLDHLCLDPVIRMRRYEYDVHARVVCTVM